MDKEILRKQIFDEIHAQFESKLRDAKRQKTQVESEFESASERWRAERRRLNSEIDRLESAVADAKESKKRAASKNGGVVDPAEIAKIHAAAEEKLALAEQTWLAERADLRKEVVRMEHTVADLLERSNNPLRRSAPVIKEQPPAQPVESKQQKQQAERELEKARGEWEAERKQFQTEIAELQTEVTKYQADIAKYQADISKYETEIARRQTESAKLNEQVTKLTRQAEQVVQNTSENESTNSAIAEQLREALQQRNFIEQQLQAANHAIQAKRATHAEEIAALEKQIGLLEADLERERSERTEVRVAPPEPGENGSSDPAELRGEIERVESLIVDINRLIEDPTCELSTVIRKNVERAELDAYLKGIFFSMGQAKGM